MSNFIKILGLFYIKLYLNYRYGPNLGFDENTPEFGGYLTKEVPEQCFYSKFMGGLVCSYE